jgi:ankyrin repeat protein
MPSEAIYRHADFLDWRSECDFRPLHVACLDEDRIATRKLLELGHSLDDESPYACMITPFSLAVSRCSVDFCKWLLQEAPRINGYDASKPLHLRRSSNGMTPIMYAAATNRLAALQWLVEISGVDEVSVARPSDGRNAIMSAAIEADFECATWLMSVAPIQAIRAHDKGGSSLLSYAAANPDYRVLKWIVEDMREKFGLVMPSSTDAHGNWHFCDVSNILLNAMAFQRTETLDYILSRLSGPLVANTLIDRIPAVFFAAKRGLLEVLKWFHAKIPGSLANTSHTDGNTIFYWAAFNGSTEVMDWMYDECDIDPTAPSYRRSWAVLGAVTNNQQAAVEWLLRRGCTLKDKDVAYWSLSAATMHGHFELIKWLDQEYKFCRRTIAENGKNLSESAATSGWPEILKWYHEKSLFTPKQALKFAKIAAGENHLEVIAWLDQEFGIGDAIGEHLMRDKQFEVFLMQDRPPMRVVEWLLSNGHVSKSNQKACLALAARRGCIEVLKCFSRHGLSLESRDNLGITPLMYAAGAGELGTVK